MAPPVGIDDPYRYRNKAQFPVGRDKDGNIITGFMHPGATISFRWMTVCSEYL